MFARTIILYTFGAIQLWTILTVTDAGPTQEECSRSYLGRQGHGVITSYNYPFNYLHNLTCTYSIYMGGGGGGAGGVDDSADATHVICLTFRRFSLESSSPFCTFDYLTMEYPNLKYCADGLWMYGVATSAPGSNVWSKDFCWTVKNSPTFDITFSSDNSISGSGFYAEYFIFPGEENERILPPGNLGQAPCSSDEWTCFNRRCIPQSYVCDGTDQCGDNSDETYVHARCGEQNVLACDFTSGSVSDGYCGFTHEGWYRTRENTAYGPQGDHTNGTSGYYVYSDVNQTSAFLLSPELSLPRNRTYCLSFWYYIYGRPAAAMLFVYVTRNQAYSQPEWSRRKAPEGEWTKGEILVHSLADIQIIFEASLDNSFSGVALDDVSILPGTCLGDDVSCNFESGTCAWQPKEEISHHDGSLHGDLTWRTHSRTIGPVGPSWDHSSKDGGGQYLFVDNTNGRTSQNRALLESSALSGFPWSTKCLSFWYHMSGRDRDCCELRVRLHEADNTLTEPRWSESGDVRNAWVEAHVTLNVNNPSQIVIEGVVSSGGHSYIALDQIILTDGRCVSAGGVQCEQGQHLCSDGACISESRLCDGNDDCLDGSDESTQAGCPGPTPPVPIPETSRTSTTTSAPAIYVPPPTCPTGFVPCTHSDTCVAMSDLCNRRNDCPNGSDEMGCPEPSTTIPLPTTCAPGTFMCLADQSCIPQDLVCDTVENCADGSDEMVEYAECPVLLPPAALTLGTGTIVGIALGCLVCIIIVVLSAVLGRRRRKHQPRRHHHHTSQRAGNPVTAPSNIATISEPSTIERHVSMLDAMRSPLRSLSGLPPYMEQDLENMGYTSDGNMTLSRPPLAVFPPEEPPPPYDSVIKEPGHGLRSAQSAASTPSSSSRQPASERPSRSRASSGATTPVDDSFGFRPQSGSGRGSSRRKSRDRARSGGHTNRGGRASSPANSLDLHQQQQVQEEEPDMEIVIPGPSDDSDTQNIYEELNVPTLRPSRLRQEPSSSLQGPPPPPPAHTMPGLSAPGPSLQPPPTEAPTPSAQPRLPSSASHISGLPPSGSHISGLPPSGSHTSGLPPSGYNYGANPPTNNHTGSPPSDNAPSSTRTMPHHRIRLGTQALQNRQGAGTYRPRTLNSSQQGMSDHEDLSPRGSIRGYQPPAGPYSLQRHPQRSAPSPSHSLEGTNPLSVHGYPLNQRHTNESPVSVAESLDPENSRGRSQRPFPLQGRLYASDRNPPKSYGSTPLRANAAPVPSPNHMAPSQAVSNGVVDSEHDRHVRDGPQEVNPALSLRAMPDPKPYASDTSHRAPRANNNTVPSPLQADNYLYRPREIGAKKTNRVPVDHIRGGPSSFQYLHDVDVGYDRGETDSSMPNTSHHGAGIGAVGGPHVRHSPVAYAPVAGGADLPYPRAPGNHSRDWNNASFASNGSQEHLINSPPAPGASRYASSHLRNGSNISSDLDSTSPLVNTRDPERDFDQESNNIELDMLTPTSV